MSSRSKDLRIMIGQRIGLDHLMPRAVELLKRQPLADGDLYPGDLLTNVIRASDWLQHRPEMRLRVVSIAWRVLVEIRQPSVALGDGKHLEGLLSEFVRCADA